MSRVRFVKKIQGIDYVPKIEYEKLIITITELQNQLNILNEEFSKFDSKFEMDKGKLESQIEDLKIKLSGKTSKVKQLQKKIKDLERDKKYWKDRYGKEFGDWRIEPIEDEEHSYFATWVNPSNRKTEEYYIPKDFNPHHVKKFKRDKNDFYTIDYYSDTDEIFVDIYIPITLYEKLKKMIVPKKKEKVEIKPIVDEEKHALLKVNDIKQIKKIYAENGEASKINKIMEKIAEYFLDNKDIPVSTGEVKSYAKCDQKTASTHLNLMRKFGIIEKLSHGKWRMPD